jgi:SAM-dependent methyltransferase
MREARLLIALLLLPLLTHAEGYQWSRDFTSRYANLWKQHLGHLKDKPVVSGLEIGCMDGRSTIWFAENITNGKDSTMTCVDIWAPPQDPQEWDYQGAESRFRHNIKLSGLGDRIAGIKGASQRVMPQLTPHSFDFVYIDGCHDRHCVIADAINSLYLLKVGGILIFDDYDWKTVRDVIDAFLVWYSPQFTVLHRGEIEEGHRKHQMILKWARPLVYTGK